MPLIKLVFTKIDNGSSSKWEVWGRSQEIQNEALFSMGQVYAKAERKGSVWRLFYRMGTDALDLEMPAVFKEKFVDQEALRAGVDKFAEWAYDNQIRLIEAHERFCDKL